MTEVKNLQVSNKLINNKVSEKFNNNNKIMENLIIKMSKNLNIITNKQLTKYLISNNNNFNNDITNDKKQKNLTKQNTNNLKDAVINLEDTKIYKKIYEKIKNSNKFEPDINIISNKDVLYNFDNNDNINFKQNYLRESMHKNNADIENNHNFHYLNTESNNFNNSSNNNLNVGTLKTNNFNPNSFNKNNESKIEEDSFLNDDDFKETNKSNIIKDSKFAVDNCQLISSENKLIDNLSNQLNKSKIDFNGSNEENNNSFFYDNADKDNDTVKEVFNNDKNNEDINEDVNKLNETMEDEYVDDEDPGFDLYECEPQYFKDTCKKLSEQYSFPKRAIRKKGKNYIDKPVNAITNIQKSEKKDDKDSKEETEDNNSENKLKSIKINDPEEVNTNINNGSKLYDLELNNSKQINKRKELLPNNVKYMQTSDSYYPVLYSNTIYDCFSLNMIVDRERTGFEESKDFKIIVNSLIAGRYQVIEYLGSAVFSKAVKCLDILKNRLVCLKIISNNKDYFDQSIDEIKLMRYINANGDVDDKNILKLYDYFYHKEHLFIVTEVLKENLYEFYKYVSEKNNLESYFNNYKRLQSIAKEVLIGLEYLHSLKVIHCDLKPENILIKSISKTKIKIIDFGSSCFIHDHLSSYMQSRSYRAPEVILGLTYDYKIDIWSLGCIMSELFTGNVLFQNDSIQSYLAKILGICGPFPEYIFTKGKNSNEYFTKEKLIYMEIADSNDQSNLEQSNDNELNNSDKAKKKMHILIPKKTSIKARLKSDDDDFVDFIKLLIEVDQNKRPSAKEALEHKFITKIYK